MVATQATTDIIDSPHVVDTRFGVVSYSLLTPAGRKPLIQVDRIHSRSTDYTSLSIKTPTIIEYAPREDTINVILKQAATTGLGPFSNNKDKSLSISTTSAESPFWSAELAGTELHSLTVRRSLLAKHAFDIIDTSVLENISVLTVNEMSSTLLLQKVRKLLSDTDTTQALDIRLTHLMLSMCQITDYRSAPPVMATTQARVWRYLKEEPPNAVTLEGLMAASNMTMYQLTHLFKKQTGLSPKKFVTNYRLNRIRQDLQGGGRRYADCVKAYGYESPDQLYRAYRKLFAEDPPLNTH